MKDQFIQFLKDNDCYDEFKKNLREENFVTIDEFIISHEPREYLYESFWWNVTTEGEEFWTVINNKWLKILKGETMSSEPAVKPKKTRRVRKIVIALSYLLINCLTVYVFNEHIHATPSVIIFTGQIIVILFFALYDKQFKD